MACTILRNDKNEITKVLSENGNESKLFKDIVSLGFDKETALKKWALVYTPTFKNWFGQGNTDTNGEPRITVIDSQPVFTASDNTTKHATENFGTFISKKDPSPLLNDIQQRFNLVKTDGSPRNIPYLENSTRIAETIEKKYPGVQAFILQDMGGEYISLSLSPHLDPDNIYHQAEAQELSERDEAVDEAMKQFLRSIGVKLKEVSEIRDRNGNILPVVAKADMVNKIVEYAKGKIGLDTLPEEAAHFLVELLEAENSPLFTSMMNNIQTFAVYQEVLESDVYQKLYQGDINKLKKEAIGKLIAKTIVNSVVEDSPANIRRALGWWGRVKEFIKNVFGRVQNDPYAEAAQMMLNAAVEEHVNVKRGMGNVMGEYYQVNTKLDDITMASASAVSRAANASYEKGSQTKDKVVDYIKDKKKFKGNTLEKLNLENEAWEIKTLSLEEAGLKQEWFVEEGSVQDRYVGKASGPYAGTIIKGRVSDKVKQHFWRLNRGKIRDLGGKEAKLRLSNNEMRKVTGTMGHTVMEELVNFYINKKGTKAEILNRSLFNAAQFNVLDQGVKDLIAQIKKVQKDEVDPEGKVVIKTEQMITNRDQSVGGSIDLIAIFSDNSAAIYDYKFVSPSKQAGYVDKTTNRIVEDPFNVKMTTYDLQMAQYKQALEQNYGVTQVRQSRIIPIHVRYKTAKDGKLTNNITVVQMGTKYSEFLEQIPVAGELTRFEDINKLIRKLLVRKASVDRQLQTKKYKAGSSFEALKAQQGKIAKQLRVLQIDQDLAYVVKSLGEDIKVIKDKLATNNEFLKSGEVNPNYLTDTDLNDLLSDLMFYQSLVNIHDYVGSMDSKRQKEYIILRDRLSGFLGPAITAVQGKMLERTSDKAQSRGVQGIKSFNLDVSWATTNFVNLSKQTNPYLRNLWEMMDTLNFNKRKITKAKAEEIQAAQDEFIAGRGIKAFDDLLDEDGTFKTKYDKEYYTRRNSAIKTNDSSWFSEEEGNVVIDEAYYNKKYKEFRAGKLKALKGRFGDNQNAINRELRKWEIAHDVKNHRKTAALNKGGQYFFRPAEKWISAEYTAIQANPAAKKFYDLYMNTVREVEEMYGERLGPNFTAEVHKGFTESAFVNGSVSESLDSTIENFQVREHDLMFGIRDENTGRLISQIPKLYIQQLRDKNGNVDSSLKSRDLGKGLLLLFDAALDYQLKSEILPEIQMMEAILSTNAIDVQSTDMFGDVLQNAKSMDTEQPKELYNTYQKFVDAYIYGSSLNSKDLKIGSRLSGRKSVMALKNMHSLAQLGLKTPVAIGAFGAGMIGLQYEASKGTFITKKNLRTAQVALMKADPKMRALSEYLAVYQKDDAESRANRLSAQYVTRHMTNDKWFAFLATADRGIDATVLYAAALNFGVDSNGSVQRLSRLPEGTKNLVESMEIVQNPLWEGTTTNVSNKAVDRYNVTIKGLTNEGELKMRNVSREIAFKVKGSMSEEDKVLYNQNLFLKLMMHYKSWLPGIAAARFGKGKYSNILEAFDEGTWRSFGSNLGLEESMDIEIHSLNYLKNYLLDAGKMAVDVVTFGYLNLTKVKTPLARASFDQWAANNENNPQFADKLKNEEVREEMFKEYLEMKRGNIRAFLMEFRATLALFLLLMSISGDEDEDGKIDIRQTYMGRKLHNVLNRIYRETAVFTQPQEFLESGRATGIPMLSLVQSGVKLVANTVDQMGDDMAGRKPYEDGDRSPRFFYTFKIAPGLNSLSKAIEQFKSQKYEKF
tara:strand:+ start:11652 stop:16883 length:5232 start_codon:yes stop_codon:yes gene_type:complete